MTNETNGLLRPRYFERQQLRAADLMVDQDYVRERLRRHNRFLHGWGVVCGAQVSRTPSDELWVLSINEGYAVTPHGDEIYIPAGVSFNIEPGVEECLGIPPPCPNPEDLSEVAEEEGPVRVIRASIDPAGKDVGGNYNEEWVDLRVLEDINLNGYVLRHITNPGRLEEGRETYYTFSESESFDAGTVVRVHSGAQRLHAEPVPEITHRYRAGSSEVGNWRLNNIGDSVYVLNAQGVQAASASFLPGSLVPIGDGIVYLVACPADELRYPQPTVPANCQPGGGVYEYSRVCETVQFKIVCELPPSHQEESPSCADLEEIVCGRAHVPCPPPAAGDDNCVVLARITVGGDSVLQIDDLSDRRQLFSDSLVQAYLRCRCETVELECVDFEDLPPDATYNVGDSFVDSGVTVTGQTFFWSTGGSTDDGFARVEAGEQAGGSGQELQVNNINLAFDFGQILTDLTLRFGEFGGNLNLEVNGDFRNFGNFDQIDGETIGGVGVTVTGGTGQAQGTLALHGEINSFAIGGQELWIDDVCPDAPTVEIECVDFDALPLDATYTVGDSFVDSGVTVTGRTFLWSNGQPTDNGFARIEDRRRAGGSGQEAQVNNINLAFDFGRPITNLNLRFGEFGGNLNLEVNGDFRNFGNFDQIDGETVGGVGVTVIGGTGQAQGTLALHGEINSFAIGGQELWIDDVCPDAPTVEIGCVDFDALPLDAVYNVGDSFVDSGVTVTGQTFFWSNGQPTDNGFARIEDRRRARGSGQEAQVNNINLAFDFGQTISNLNLRYGEFGGNLNLEVNGDLRNFNNFRDIDGATIGGVDVSLVAEAGPRGVLALQGEISSFAIGGQELWIDDVCPNARQAFPSDEIRIDVAGESIAVDMDEAEFDLARGRDEPIDVISGIGGVRGSRLREAGAENVLALAALPPEQTAEIAEVSVEMATRWRGEAREMLRR